MQAGLNRRHRVRTRGSRWAALGAVTGILLVSGCGSEQPSTTVDQAGADEGPGSTPMASALVQDADGNEVGTVEFEEVEGAVELRVDLSGLEPGFHGLHLHAIGACEPDSAAPDDPANTGDFMSAGGHIGADQSGHPNHAGDLPSLLVTEAGTVEMTVQTDRLTRDVLLDDDGSALMVHAGLDNFANIPERYAPEGPDADTTATGDAGGRAACGVVEASGAGSE